uniref:Uncharacterized protein n=1 Tax=Steinernema glaseri TaxID=37863 RepID=A0A1I8AI83_9BILA
MQPSSSSPGLRHRAKPFCEIIVELIYTSAPPSVVPPNVFLRLRRRTDRRLRALPHRRAHVDVDAPRGATGLRRRRRAPADLQQCALAS